MVSVPPSPIRTAPPRSAATQRLAIRDQASQPLLASGWKLLYSGLTPSTASETLLDPSESLQISLQIPIGEEAEDWDHWLEACNRQLNVPLRR